MVSLGPACATGEWSVTPSTHWIEWLPNPQGNRLREGSTQGRTRVQGATIEPSTFSFAKFDQVAGRCARGGGYMSISSLQPVRR